MYVIHVPNIMSKGVSANSRYFGLIQLGSVKLTGHSPDLARSDYQLYTEIKK